MGVVGSVMGGWSVMPAIVQQLLRTEVLRWPAGQSSGSMRSCARDAESVCLLVRKVHWRSSTGRCEWFPKSYVTDSAPAWENVLKGRSSRRSAPSGHSPRQAPSPSHRTSETTRTFPLTISSAPSAQAGTHSPHPVHNSSSILMIGRPAIAIPPSVVTAEQWPASHSTHPSPTLQLPFPLVSEFTLPL